MRLFLALFPSVEIRKTFQKIQNGLGQFNKYLRFVDPKLMHVTIRFFGAEVSDNHFEKLKADLTATISQNKRFSLQIGELKYGFEGRMWPKILHVCIKRNQYLDKLLSSVEEVVKNGPYSGFASMIHNKPAFHITLARTKNKLSEEVVRSIRKRLKKFELWDGFLVKSVCLVESRLTEDGPCYIIREKYNLR